MSWIDDQIYGDFDMVAELQDKLEEEWSLGYHIDQNGDRKKLIDLKRDHLINMINYFETLDIDCELLHVELDRRNKLESFD